MSVHPSKLSGVSPRPPRTADRNNHFLLRLSVTPPRGDVEDRRIADDGRLAVKYSAIPGPQGLYDPAFERDSCGVAAVADIKGRRSNKIVADGITALINLEHRGAAGADPAVGDGAGILFQIPEAFLREVVDFDLPVAVSADGNEPDGCAFAVGTAFLPADPTERAKAKSMAEVIIAEEGLELLGWRPVPTDAVGAGVGRMAVDVMPAFEQLFLAGPATGTGSRPYGLDLDRLVYAVRKRIEHETAAADVDVYFPSLSSRTLVYKGMLTTRQLPDFFSDIRDQRVEGAIAIVHSRFSTNTFPAWSLAHPFRFIAHNGEINTVRGNRNRMRAREAMLASDVIPGDLKRIYPICSPAASDSASFDEVLELLHLGGRSLPHAVLMMIPEAWENHTSMSPEKKAFYAFHGALMEPWDGPASIAFTDGSLIGAVLDRNGLRPSRYWVTEGGMVVMASEGGVVDIPPAKVVRKGRLQPGKMFLIDTAQGRIVDDEEVKEDLAAAQPYRDWVHAGLMRLTDLPAREHVTVSHRSVLARQKIFGYTEEELRVLVTPMAASGAEGIGSMGTDTPEAVLSTRPRLIFDYFSQLFAQVTNPPPDAIREAVVTSLSSVIGPEANLLEPGPWSCRQIVLPFPVLDNDDLARLMRMNAEGNLPGFASAVISGLYDVDGGPDAPAEAIE